MKRRVPGTVVAVFSSSFYLRAGPAHVCIGTCRIGMGPLNMRSTAPPDFDWSRAGLAVGDAVVIGDDVVQVGACVGFDLAARMPWRPRAIGAPPDARAVAAGLAALDRLAMDAVPDDGLARLVWCREARQRDPALQLAAAPGARLSGWLMQALGADSAADGPGTDGIEVLLGLGPGLTPSGDDLIAGALVALHALGRRHDLETLASLVHRHAGERTSPLSAAHLDAAARGMAAQVLHDVLESVVTNDVADLGERLARLARVGHTSGWDGLAGVAITLRAWLSANPAE